MCSGLPQNFIDLRRQSSETRTRSMMGQIKLINCQYSQPVIDETSENCKFTPISEHWHKNHASDYLYQLITVVYIVEFLGYS
jgi:hypothetical protein